MPLTVIGNTFPSSFLWEKYETRCVNSLKQQINNKFPHDKNLLINLTWFGPQFNNINWKEYLDLINAGLTFDNLFLLCTVDPAMINPDQIADIVSSLGNPKLFKIGNFDTEYHFNFFAPVLLENFKSYSDEELQLVDPTWLYINYNRKPREHRVKFVKQLQQRNLSKYGIVTLGKPNSIYDKDPDNQLYLSIGEDPKNYVDAGHWFDVGVEDEFGIPHDVLSLHRLDYWQQHFLNIIGATEFNVWDDIFVSETQFKPIIGLRPFLINGNIRTYKWLVDNGFRTFNHYFNNIDFENEDTVHESICQAIEWLTTLTKDEILNLYNKMLPDLRHNKARFYEYANEQQFKINNLFQ